MAFPGIHHRGRIEEGYIRDFATKGSPGFNNLLLLLLSFDMCFTCMTPNHLLECIPSVFLFPCELSFLLVLNVVSR